MANNLLTQLIAPLQHDPANFLMLAFGALGVTVFSLKGPAKKGRLATARFAGNTELRAARTLALKQMRERRRNALTLYINRPKKSDDARTLYLPEAQRGIAVIGGPGSGKTFSLIDPAIRSTIDQGFPLIVYDFKYPTQSSRLVGYAAKAGYDVRIFAPGYPESEVCNPLDFLRDATDAESARQIATVLNRNFALGDGGKEDPFFTNAGDQLVEAVLLAAKATEQPDLLTCQAILALSDLAGRVEAAEHLSGWVRTGFSQLVSVKDSEKTAASIVATAATSFTRFMKKNILPAFSGASTLPIDLAGKQLLVLGMDRERRDVVGPLLAVVLHMVVTRNVVKKRTDPLVVALDELPTLYLPSLVQWLNENREDGLACILGFQNLAQLEKVYGKEQARSILGGCASKAIFNPQDYESARTFSDYLGEEEVHYKSRSRSSGGKSGASTSLAEQEKTRKLFEPSQFLKLPAGECVLLNPGYRSGREATLPLVRKVVIPREDIEASNASERVWPKLRAYLASRRPECEVGEKELEERRQVAERLLPAKGKQTARPKIDLKSSFNDHFGRPLRPEQLAFDPVLTGDADP